MKNKADDRRDKLVWKFQNQGPQMTDFGDPTTTTTYRLCLYAGSAVASVVVPAGANWQTFGTGGFLFHDTSGSPNGAQKAKLKGGSGAPGVIPRAFVKGKGSNLPDTISLPPTLPIIVQMVNDSNGVCFSTFYDTGDVVTSDGTKFKAKSSSVYALPGGP